MDSKGAGERVASYAAVLRCRGWTTRGKLESAREACERALSLAERSQDDTALYSANRTLGRLEVEQGDYSNGVPRWLEAVRIARKLGDKRAESTALAALGGAAHYSYAFDTAIEYLEQAIVAAQESRDPTTIAIANNQLGAMFMMTDRPEMALQQIELAQKHLKSVDNMDGLIGMFVHFGRAQAIGRTGDPGKALKLMEQGLKRYAQIKNPIYRGLTHHFVAEMNLAIGNLDGALTYVNSAIELLSASPARSRESLLLAGEIFKARGELEEAVRVLDLLISSSSEPFLEESEALRVKAGCLAEMSQPDAALTAWQQAHEAHEVLDEKISTSRAEFSQARLNAALLEQDIKSMRQRASQERSLRNVATVAALIVMVLVVLVFRLQLRQRRLETERERTYRLETIGRLTGGVAHDFNNILTVVLQGLSLLEQRVEQDEDAVVLIQEAEQAAASGAGIVQQLLSFARKKP
ncbi:MAG: hypothetical protein AAFQ82_19060 [Myxococcota bacterium]